MTPPILPRSWSWPVNCNHASWPWQVATDVTVYMVGNLMTQVCKNGQGLVHRGDREANSLNSKCWRHTGTLSPELFPKRDSYIQRRRDLNSAKPPVKDQHILFTRDTCIHPASFNRHDLLESKFSGYFTIFFENFMIIENYIILMILVDFIFFGFVIQSKL